MSKGEHNIYSSSQVRHIALHPHACGEHITFMSSTKTMYGSSPRMWGTLDAVTTSGLLIRFIPTHVGNTRLPIFCHESKVRFIPTHVGNTPLRSQFYPDCDRFIPTHVGNTSQIMGGIIHTPVHPHACGEHEKEVA